VTGIRDAVRALVCVVLPHARLVWGGHPAITPLVRVVAEDINITGEDRVRLFQSSYFKGRLPRDNATFESVTRVRGKNNDRDASLHAMREKMISSEQFAAAVFIGGMEGVEDECRMFHAMHPNALVLPVASTGGAARMIYEKEPGRFPPDVATNLAYPALFRRVLDLR
jgi:hypothetical protein